MIKVALQAPSFQDYISTHLWEKKMNTINIWIDEVQSKSMAF
jgi:hypothetical protein